MWPCSINITSREEGSCPTDLLVAPCAVPSASLKEFGASREEGQWQDQDPVAPSSPCSRTLRVSSSQLSTCCNLKSSCHQLWPSADVAHNGRGCAGIVVPVTFQVGDCVDFITRLSKLDKYSDKTTSRSLERIFVTGRWRERYHV